MLAIRELQEDTNKTEFIFADISQIKEIGELARYDDTHIVKAVL